MCTRSQNFVNAFTSAAAATKLMKPIVTGEKDGFGVEFLPGTPYSDGCELEKQFDYVINCAGLKFLGPKKFLTGPLADCIEPRTGQIMCNKFMQVTN